MNSKEKNETFNSQIIDSINDVILIIDPANYQIIHANKAALKLLNLDKENLVGKTCYEATHHRSKPCTPPNDTCPMQEMLQTQNSAVVEHQHFDSENHRTDFEVSVHPIKDKNGKIIQALHISREITERKEQERTEKIRSEEILKIMDGIGDLLFVMDKNRVITKVNKATCDAFKKKPEELIGKYCHEIVHGTTMPWCNCPATKTFETKQTAIEEVNDPHLGIPLLITTSPILDEQGEVAQVIHIAKDITTLKKTEESLRSSQEEYRSLFVNMIDGFAYCQMIFDESKKPVDFVYLQVNDAFEKITGLKREIIVGKNATQAIQGIREANPELFEIYGRVALTGRTERFEVFFKPLNMWLYISVYCPRKGYFVAIFENITEDKLLENKLKESEEKYRFYTEKSPVAFFVVTSEGKYTQVNNAATKMLFYSKNEFLKMSIVDILFEKDISFGLKQFATVLETGESRFEIALKRKDGEPVYVILNSVGLPDGNVMAFCENITERKKAEEELKEAEEKYRTLLNVANVLVQSVDAEGKYAFVNEEWKKVLGYTDADIEKITMKDVVRKDHLQYCMSAFKEVMNGLSIHDVETIFVAKDGREIVVSGNACPVFKDGKFVSTVAFFVDITERKKNEEKLKENSQRIELMNEKLRVVGGLTRHDVRNKLSAVTGYTYLLKKKHADQEDIVEGLSKMEQAVRESMKIFDFAKLYEQLGAEELTYIDVGAKLNEAAALFSGSLPKIINECHGLTVLADSFLRQMFYNFIDNTRKYGQKTTTIKVNCHKTNQGGMALVYEDDGVGISAENKLKLFSEGFSTGGSTGFGLFLTKKMIDVYGWTITEEGEPGKGAKFVISIPRASVS